MTISSRDQRATIYPFEGSSDGGFVTSTYGLARGTYWCRVSTVAGDEFIVDAQIGSVDRAVVEFADEVPIAEHDLIVIAGVQWKAGTVTTRRRQRAKVLRIERSSEAVDLL